MARLETFFKRYARNWGIGVAEEVRKEVIAISSTRYPPASRPGKPPRMRSGKFVKGIRTVKTAHGMRLIMFAPYSSFVLLGTSRMRARPALEIAVNNVLKRRGVKTKWRMKLYNR